MMSHHPFFEHFLESITVILSIICLSQNMISCGISLMLLSLTNLLLVFLWTSEVPGHLCFAVQIQASEIPLYHILLWTLQSCLLKCFMMLVISLLVSLLWLTQLLDDFICMYLIMNCLSTCHIMRIFISYEQMCSWKFFYRTQLLTELLEDKQ